MTSVLGFPTGFALHTSATGEKILGGDDLLAIICPQGTTVSAQLTQNTFVGAPVHDARNKISQSRLCRAVLVNSGVANVATGKKGLLDVSTCARVLAESIGVLEEEVLVSSTGKIGEFLPMEVLLHHIPLLSDSDTVDISTASKAIMTTDLVPKYASVLKDDYELNGISKGSGMIAPNMATMLAFVMTDAKIHPRKLDAIWKRCVAKSFNMISVDGCESTSDMALLLSSQQKEGVNESEFESDVQDLCITLAKKIARDGEGATCLIEATIQGSENEESAQILAKSIINSDLLKCAIHGKDLNWGRVLQAMGSTHLSFSWERCSCFIDELCIFEQGSPCDVSESQESRVFQSDTVRIRVELGEGDGSATAWGCDLSKEYIAINADYRT